MPDADPPDPGQRPPRGNYRAAEDIPPASTSSYGRLGLGDDAAPRAGRYSADGFSVDMSRRQTPTSPPGAPPPSPQVYPPAGSALRSQAPLPPPRPTGPIPITPPTPPGAASPLRSQPTPTSVTPPTGPFPTIPTTSGTSPGSGSPLRSYGGSPPPQSTGPFPATSSRPQTGPIPATPSRPDSPLRSQTGPFPATSSRPQTGPIPTTPPRSGSALRSQGGSALRSSGGSAPPQTTGPFSATQSGAGSVLRSGPLAPPRGTGPIPAQRRAGSSAPRAPAGPSASPQSTGPIPATRSGAGSALRSQTGPIQAARPALPAAAPIKPLTSPLAVTLATPLGGSPARARTGPRHARGARKAPPPARTSARRGIFLLVGGVAATSLIALLIVENTGGIAQGDAIGGAAPDRPNAPGATPPPSQPADETGPGTGPAALPAPQLNGNRACGARGVVPATPRHATLTAHRCALRFLSIHGSRIPVHAGTNANSQIVGWIDRAGDRTWFVGQAIGGGYRAGGDFNTNWAYTQADNRSWGWVPGLYFRVGSNGRPDPSLSPCGTRCRPY